MEQVTLSLSLSRTARDIVFSRSSPVPPLRRRRDSRREKSSNAIPERRRAFLLRVDSVHRGGRGVGEMEVCSIHALEMKFKKKERRKEKENKVGRFFSRWERIVKSRSFPTIESGGGGGSLGRGGKEEREGWWLKNRGAGSGG